MLRKVHKLIELKLNFKQTKAKKNHFLFPQVLLGFIEDVLSWNDIWLSIIFIFIFNILFITIVFLQINLSSLVISLCILFLIIDAIEHWIKYRTKCFRNIDINKGKKIHCLVKKISKIFEIYLWKFLYLRRTDHAQAFLIANIFLMSIIIFSLYVNGYIFVYTICMIALLFKQIVEVGTIVFKNFHWLVADSDNELDDLIPIISETDRNLLSLEQETEQITEKHNLDDWKPELPSTGDLSDSSESSSSLLNNVANENITPWVTNVETSDSSEDEYIPKVLDTATNEPEDQQKVPWSNTVYKAYSNLTGAMTNIMNAVSNHSEKNSSSNSSIDGFEVINESDYDI